MTIAVGLLLGAAIGLFGGGGGILAVPLLLLVGYSITEASTISLMVVLAGSLAGLVVHARASRVDWRVGALFSAVGAVGAVIGARLSLHAPTRVTLGALAGLLFIAAIVMARRARVTSATEDSTSAGPETSATQPKLQIRRTAPPAAGLGFVTGFLGVGGGFLVVPALATAAGLTVRRAAATALVVVSANSALALLARWPWNVPASDTLVVTATAVAASIGAARLSGRVPSQVLAWGFALLVAFMAVVTLTEAIRAG